MKNRKLKLSPIVGARKFHTSIYLLRRHRDFLENMMKVTGLSMTGCIAKLIEDSILKYS